MESVLERINQPRDLDALQPTELTTLADEMRQLIISTVSQTGGHLAANLGVVELTIALLRVFNPPEDKIVWDVSHQTYPYKILTGRRDRMGTIRQWGGLSGFAKRSESPYDAFGAGHAGTAISAALGLAAARDQRGGAAHVLAVVGDASACCGISLEGMNNVADTTRRLIIVLNDNEMSISENVGSIARYLGKMLAGPGYNRSKRRLEGVLKRLHMGPFRNAYYRLEEAVKSLFLRSVIFEEFGLRYIGPVDGHNIAELTNALTIARDSDKPILLHVSTRKGLGYPYAEEQPEKWHGTGCFNVESGVVAATEKGAGWSAVFGGALERVAAADARVVAITAAMCAGTGLQGFAKRFPKRFFDVGICEEHGAVFAAGLAADGYVPVYALYSTFSQRAVDCIIHDICLQKLPVVLCLDRAGIVGDDGPTHHGVFDIPLLRAVPNLIFMQPRDEAELAHMLHTAVGLGQPVAIRYPRGCGPGAAAPATLETLPVGRAEVLSEGADAVIWALGDMVPLARQAATLLGARGLAVGVVNARFIRPLDTELLLGQARAVPLVVTLENGVVTGGFGSAVAEALGEAGRACRVLRLGWPDAFIPQGKPEQLMREYGLTAESVAARVAEAMTAGDAQPRAG